MGSEMTLQMLGGSVNIPLEDHSQNIDMLVETDIPQIICTIDRSVKCNPVINDASFLHNTHLWGFLPMGFLLWLSLA